MVVADTDVLIAAMRGHDVAKSLLRQHRRDLHLTAVTVMELYIGATNESKREAVRQIIASHEILYLDKATSARAIALVQTYNSISQSLYLGDALIAATCLENGASLLTFNRSDFKAVKGLQLVG